MARQYSSNAVTSTIYSTFGSADATMVVSLPVTGWPTSYSFTVIVDPDTASEEVVTVTSLVSTGASSITYNVTRGATGGDGTTAKTHAAAAVVKHGVSARDFSEPQVHIDATVAHGATGAVVGTTNTQTLTGKTIDAASNTISNLANANVAVGAAIDKTKISGTAVTVADTGTVTNAMLAGSIAPAKITGTAVTAADTGTVTSTMLAGSIAPAKVTGTAITAADTGTVTSTMIADGTIVNADINASAAIAVSKLASSSVTIGGTAATLGGSSVTSVTGMVLDATSTIGGVSGTSLAADRTAWTSYTPTVGGWSGTALTATGFYKQIGKTVFVRINLAYGAGTFSGGTNAVKFSLPTASIAAYTGTFTGMALKGVLNIYSIFGYIPVSDLGNLMPAYLASGVTSGITSTNLFTFASGDSIILSGIYEAA